MKNKEWLNLGSIKVGKTGSSYLQLGTAKSKYKPYNIKLVVEDLDGKVLASVLNPNLNIQDPRKRPGITDDQKDKIPEWLRAEVSLSPAKD